LHTNCSSMCTLSLQKQQKKSDSCLKNGNIHA
jgi:hypothetical protein